MKEIKPDQNEWFVQQIEALSAANQSLRAEVLRLRKVAGKIELLSKLLTCKCAAWQGVCYQCQIRALARPEVGELGDGK